MKKHKGMERQGQVRGMERHKGLWRGRENARKGGPKEGIDSPLRGIPRDHQEHLLCLDRAFEHLPTFWILRFQALTLVKTLASWKPWKLGS
jgi:hypothetical protein